MEIQKKQEELSIIRVKRAGIQKIEMNASNNYKDAAQSGLREFQEMLREQERIVFS